MANKPTKEIDEDSESSEGLLLSIIESTEKLTQRAENRRLKRSLLGIFGKKADKTAKEVIAVYTHQLGIPKEIAMERLEASIGEKFYYGLLNKEIYFKISRLAGDPEGRIYEISIAKDLAKGEK